jgi:hypothetical protein
MNNAKKEMINALDEAKGMVKANDNGKPIVCIVQWNVGKERYDISLHNI